MDHATLEGIEEQMVTLWGLQLLNKKFVCGRYLGPGNL